MTEPSSIENSLPWQGQLMASPLTASTGHWLCGQVVENAANSPATGWVKTVPPDDDPAADRDVGLGDAVAGCAG